MARPLRVAVLGACAADAATLTTALAKARPALHTCATPTWSAALHSAVPASALAAALQALHACDLILLLGLAPWASDAATARATEHTDAQLRAMLQRAGLAFRVLYGTTAEQLRHALDAIDSIAINDRPMGTMPSYGTKNAIWSHPACEKCSDPDCERRLFTGLRS